MNSYLPGPPSPKYWDYKLELPHLLEILLEESVTSMPKHSLSQDTPVLLGSSPSAPGEGFSNLVLFQVVHGGAATAKSSTEAGMRGTRV